MKGNAFASKKRNERIAKVASMIVLILLTLIVIFPIYWIFRSSLMTNGELYAYPPSFTPPAWRFENYAATLKEFPFWKYLKNTMTIIVPSVIGATITATMGGYAFTSSGRLGYASAISAIFFVLIGIFTMVLFVTSKFWVFYMGGDD